jgi:4-amino-4-deoxy-L-arabinose transferase-like glycosyltransferase
VQLRGGWRAGIAGLSRLLESEHVEALVAIFVGALFLRGVWAGFAAVDPNDGRFDDSVFYHNVAISLSKGAGFTNPFTSLPTAQWPPGYPFFLGGIYSVFGPTLAGARLANVVLGAATVALLYILALRLFDKRTALLAALLLAVFPGQVFFVSLVWSETLFTFAFVLALLLIVMVLQGGDRQRPWWLLGAGLIFGAAALIRGQGLLLPLIAVITWGVLGQRWAQALRWTGVTVALMAVLILPWSIRNYVVLDSPVFISSSFGSNFYQGHNKKGWEGTEQLVAEYGPLTTPGAEVKIGNIGLRKGLQFLVTHPLEEIRMTGLKIRDLYRDDYISLDLIEGYGTKRIMGEGLRRSLDHLANGFYFLVLGASVLSVVYCRREDRAKLFFPILVVGLWTLGSIAFFAIVRFHFPVMPVFCLLAARAAALPRRTLLVLLPVVAGAVLIPQLA